MNKEQKKQYIWILDSAKAPLDELPLLIAPWAECRYVPDGDPVDFTTGTPDALIVPSEIDGGPTGETFRELTRLDIPVLVAAQVRSLTQAIEYFRAGAADYLPLPLTEHEINERVTAATQRFAAHASYPEVMVEIESLSSGEDEVPEVVITGIETAPAPAQPSEPQPAEPDILAELEAERDAPENAARKSDAPDLIFDTQEVSYEGVSQAAAALEEEDDQAGLESILADLPCGILIFDAQAELVFANTLALEMFSRNSLQELADSLENNLSGFAAISATGKKVQDNQWPHMAALKDKAPRALLLSIEQSEKRRIWLKINCRPALADGKVSRLCATVVNMTGEAGLIVKK